jgi:hypothetical protein
VNANNERVHFRRFEEWKRVLWRMLET